MLAVTAVAWAATAAAMTSAAAAGDKGMGMAMPSSQGRPTGDAVAGRSWASLGMWSLMVVAMMAPLLIGPLRHVAARTLPRRRARAVVLFVVAYAAVWIAAGVLLLALAQLLERFGPAMVITLGAAVVWQLGPVKQRCLNRHHAHPPVPAFGGRANLGAVRLGAVDAAWCVGSCWALMLVPLVVPSARLAVMAAVTAWIWAEQFDRPVAAGWRVRLPIRAVRLVLVAAR